MRTTQASRDGGRSAMGNETDDKRQNTYRGRGRGRRGEGADALVTNTKERMSRCEWGGMSGTLSDRRLREKRQIQGEKDGTSREDGVPIAGKKDRFTLHLLRAISRAALISGASVRRVSAIAKNGCCKSCVASGRFSASTSSVLAR